MPQPEYVGPFCRLHDGAILVWNGGLFVELTGLCRKPLDSKGELMQE
jgi:hypothetical protein